MSARGLAPITACVVLASCGGGGAATAATPQQARACIEKSKLRVLGGPRAPGDTNAPDTELVVGSANTGTFLAFYDDAKRADRYAPAITANAKKLGATVERHGKLTILWMSGPNAPHAARIRSCAVSGR